MRQKGGDMSQITKKAIEASLKNLLLKKPFDKITINDIAEDCGISRMTFYYHFKDIYDLVEWACEEDAKKILEGKDDYKTWTQGFLNLFEEVLKNKPFILNVYRSVGREQVENYLYEIVYDLLLNVIEEKAQGMTVRDEDKEFIADFYKYAFVGLMLDWVKNGMKEDPHKIVKKVEFLLSGSLSVSLERFRTGRISSKTDK
jgi:probable dihydroxyacetone kinase regulator